MLGIGNDKLGFVNGDFRIGKVEGRKWDGFFDFGGCEMDFGGCEVDSGDEECDSGDGEGVFFDDLWRGKVC